MEINDLLMLLGGLALFLYGMQMMSTGLETAAGNKMKTILEKLTSNRFKGVLAGAAITAVIQSSSATTVMVVGFVNSGMMTLKQAVWIIMGANIGTTITGQLIALDVGAIAPLFAFIGVVFIVFIKKVVFHHYGQIIAGLGILFIGMEMMSSSMMPLRDSAAFVDLVSNFSNPLIGILAGMIFTAIIQSSSASVGILQALAVSGVIGLPTAVYVLFGQNIGTCITAVLASIGTSRSAKRTTVIHLMFNIFGTVLFTVICMVTPLTSVMMSFAPDNPAAQIANMHTLFNIVTTLLLLPFGTLLADLAERILPEQESEEPDVMRLCYIRPDDKSKEHQIGSSAMAYKRNPMRSERIASLSRYVIADALNPAITSATQWFERTLDDSANKRMSIPEGFLAVDGILDLYMNVVDGLVVYPKVIEQHLLNELPFMATENIMMDAVKAGGNRQELHERIRIHSMAAGRVVKEEGKKNDLLERIAADPVFGMNMEQLTAIMEPKNFVGRAPQQVEEFLAQVIAPILEANKDELGLKAVINV